MRLAYSLMLVLLAIILSPVWAAWLVLTPKVRAGFRQKLGFYPKHFTEKLKRSETGTRIWVHTVSVGEFNAARPLINALLEVGYPLLLTTTTRTGQTLARQTFPQLPVGYFPFDFGWAVKQAFQTFQPAMLIVFETEIWPNILWKSQKRGIPAVLVNGRLSEKSFGAYFRFRWFFRHVLPGFAKLLMQSQADAERMIRLGAPTERVVTVGNIKFDLPPLDSRTEEATATLSDCFGFPAEAPVVVFASTHQSEDEIFLDIFKALQSEIPDIKGILVPRHPERFDAVAALIAKSGLAFSRRSELAPERPMAETNSIILLDSIGELKAVFKLATVACMGGTFVPIGGHNPLEPIQAGIPVVFGPSMHNFKEISALARQAKAGFQAETPEEAAEHLKRLLTDPKLYCATVENGQTLLLENQGVLARILEHLLPLLPAKEKANRKPDSRK